MFIHNNTSESKRPSRRRSSFVIAVLLASLMLGAATAAIVQPLFKTKPQVVATLPLRPDNIPQLPVLHLSAIQDGSEETNSANQENTYFNIELSTSPTAIAKANISPLRNWQDEMRSSGSKSFAIDIDSSTLTPRATLTSAATQQFDNNSILSSPHLRLDPIDPIDWDCASLFMAHLQLEGISHDKSEVVLLQGRADGGISSRDGVWMLNQRKGNFDSAASVITPHVTKNNESVSNYFDADKWGKVLAIAELWSRDRLLSDGLFVQYDSASKKYLPHATFTNATRRPSNRVLAIQHQWCRDLLQSPEINSAYVRYLDKFHSNEYLENLKTKLTPAWYAIHEQLLSNNPNYTPQNVWSAIEQRATMIRRLLDIKALALGSYSIDSTNQYQTQSSLTVRVRNCMKLAIEIKELKTTTLTGKEAVDQVIAIPIQRLEPRTFSNSNTKFQQLIESGGVQSSLQSVAVVARLVGSELWHEIPLQPMAYQWSQSLGRPRVEKIDDVLKQHPFLELDAADRQVRSRSGNWNVAGDLVLPAGWNLVLSAGTQLAMSKNAVIHVEGRFSCEGTKDSPVKLIAAAENWAGVFVTAAAQSRWSHVHVYNTVGIARPGWRLTGGITFYESPVEFHHCEFNRHRGEDAVNVMRTKFLFDNCTFRESFSDAFDGDFVEGEMRNTQFEQIGGDAFDISGSRVTIENVSVIGVADKAISAGENSHLTAKNITVQDAKIAVCSKDQSTVTATKLFISDCDYGLAAYTKKLEYGPASLHATDLRSDDSNQRHLCQTGSTVALDGREFPTTKIDVNLLYEGETK